MNTAKIFLCLFIFQILGHSSSKAQATDTLLNFLGNNFPQEKIHLHLDKQLYNPRDTIWFKAYLIADNSNTAISKICYTELLDERGMLLQRKIMPVVVSGAASHFVLPDTLNTEKLFIRAYTAWMLNFDSSLLYLQQVNIISSKPVLKKAAAKNITLSFFPEGGDMVNEISSIIAFKATDQYGNPINVTGHVVDEDEKIITNFSSIHDGMGYFDLLPQEGKQYKAVWKDDNDVEHSRVLPEAKKTGIVLNTINVANLVQFTLTRPGSPRAAATYHIVAQMKQAVVYSATISLSKKASVTTHIKTDSLPSGILQLTVFDDSQSPVAERLVFINNHNYYFKTNIIASEKNLVKRGKNVLELAIGDSLLANLSIAVTDASINPAREDDENIVTQLLLTSDLKGYVYHPAYYFSNDDDSTKQHLDLVMMTNGWRRFRWENILAKKWPALTYRPEEFITVKGALNGLSERMQQKTQLSTVLHTNNNADEYFNTPLLKDGQFAIGPLYFFDSAKLYYQLSDKKAKNLTPIIKFAIENTFIKSPSISPGVLTILQKPFKTDSLAALKSNFLSRLQREQDEKNKIKTLSTVVLKTREKTKKELMDEEYTSAIFSGGDAVLLNVEDDLSATGYPSVLSYLQGRVPFLQISDKGASSFGRRTQIFINESRADSSGLIDNMSMSEVAIIKVFRAPFFGGIGNAPGGAIAVYTKKGGTNINSIKGLAFANINGYSVVKEFYSPDYEKTNDPLIKDSRSTLYWKPFILMDKYNRSVSIPFYNSDNCKRIRVVLEGINELGKLTSNEILLE